MFTMAVQEVEDIEERLNFQPQATHDDFMNSDRLDPIGADPCMPRESPLILL